MLKKTLANRTKAILYTYALYFILAFKVISRDITVINNGKVLGVLYIILSFILIKILDILLNESYHKITQKIRLPHLARNVISVTIFIISLLFILKEFYGVNLKTFLTTSAILSAVIGLALQDTLTNFIAGIVLTSEHFFEKGDTVIMNGMVGKIQDTNWRSTRINRADGATISIPNNQILKESTVNFFKKSNVLLVIKVNACYTVPPNKIKEVLMNLALNHKDVLKDPGPSVFIGEFAESSINYELRVWIYDDYLQRRKVETDLYAWVWYAFKRENIKIPYPIREIITPRDIKVPEAYGTNKNYLKRVEFFNKLDEENLNKLLHKTHLKTYGRGEFIFFQDEPGDSFFIIKHGKVSIIIDHREITTLNEGDFFGEMSLLTGKTRSASVQATLDTEVLVLDKENFKGLIQNNSFLLESILEYLTEREKANLLFRKELDANKENTGKQNDEIKNNILKKMIEFFEL